MSHTAILRSISASNGQVVVLMAIVNDQTKTEELASYCAQTYVEAQAQQIAAQLIAAADAAEQLVAPYESINEAIKAGAVITLATSGS